MDENVDILGASEQPRCAQCGVLMRSTADKYHCLARGHQESIPAVAHPGDGSELLDFRRRR